MNRRLLFLAFHLAWLLGRCTGLTAQDVANPELTATELSDSNHFGPLACDAFPGEGLACDELRADVCDQPNRRRRAPVMIGDFYSGSLLRLNGDAVVDRFLVLADDLDAPLVLPPPSSTLTITEPGPIGIFRTPVASVQQLRTLLLNGSPIPPRRWPVRSIRMPR